GIGFDAIFDTLLERAFLGEQQTIRGAEIVDLFARETAALQAHDIEAAEVGVVADRRTERDEIGRHQGARADERVAAGAGVLVDGGQATEESVVADLSVAADSGGLSHDDVVVDDAIVGDVAIAHDQTIIADRRDAAPAHGAAVNGGVFADDVVVADDELRRFAPVRQILRRAAEAYERPDGVALAEFGVALDEDVRDELRALADLHVRANHAAWADLHVGAEFGAIVDDGGFVDLRAHIESCGRSAFIAANSQSVASSPRTSTRPRNLKM